MTTDANEQLPEDLAARVELLAAEVARLTAEAVELETLRAESAEHARYVRDLHEAMRGMASDLEAGQQRVRELAASVDRLAAMRGIELPRAVGAAPEAPREPERQADAPPEDWFEHGDGWSRVKPERAEDLRRWETGERPKPKKGRG